MQINTAIFHRSLLLDESMLEPLDSRCPFCCGTNRQEVYTLQKSPDVMLLHCHTCHAVSASRMPTDEVLGKYYGGYYESSHRTTSEGQITFDEPTRFGRKLADMYRRQRNDACVSILDFGGGDATISHSIVLLPHDQNSEPGIPPPGLIVFRRGS